MAWTNTTKPTNSNWTNTNPVGRTQYDQAGIIYDDSNIFYDGVNLGAYTYTSKPNLASVYPEFNWEFSLGFVSSIDFNGIGNIFANKNSVTLDSCSFFLTRVGNPTGNMVAKLYSTTGTIGVNAIPTGAALATSDNVSASIVKSNTDYSAANIFAEYQLINFPFSGVNKYLMSANTNYAITMEYSGGGLGNFLSAGGGSSNLIGNAVTLINPTWTSDNLDSFIFYVYVTSAYTKVAKPS